MKHIFKIFAKTTLTLLFITLLMSSCEKENVIQEHPEGTNKKTISLSQFKIETKIKEFSKTLKISTAENSLNKNIALSDFYIDTETILKYIAINDKTTYSFRIYPLSENETENETYNLIYHKENNVWQQSVFLMKERVVTTQNQNIFENVENIYNSNATTSNTKSRMGEMCINESISVACDGSCREMGSCDGFACPTGQCIQRTLSVVECASNGGGTSNGTGTGANDPYSGASSSSNPYSFTPNMFDNPVFDDPNYIKAVKAESFFSQLQDVEKVWANQNVVTYNEIINYLVQSRWSLESINFAKQMIELAMANNSTFSFDSSLNATNAMSFNSVAEFQNYLNNQPQPTVGTDYQSIQTQNQVVASAKFRLSGVADVKVNIKQEISPYSISNVTSEVVGIPLVDGFTQSDYTVNITGNNVTVDVYGVYSINLFIQGIGTIYKKSKHYQIRIDKTTGLIYTTLMTP